MCGAPSDEILAHSVDIDQGPSSLIAKLKIEQGDGCLKILLGTAVASCVPRMRPGRCVLHGGCIQAVSCVLSPES